MELAEQACELETKAMKAVVKRCDCVSEQERDKMLRVSSNGSELLRWRAGGRADMGYLPPAFFRGKTPDYRDTHWPILVSIDVKGGRSLVLFDDTYVRSHLSEEDLAEEFARQGDGFEVFAIRPASHVCVTILVRSTAQQATLIKVVNPTGLATLPGASELIAMQANMRCVHTCGTPSSHDQ